MGENGRVKEYTVQIVRMVLKAGRNIYLEDAVEIFFLTKPTLLRYVWVNFCQNINSPKINRIPAGENFVIATAIVRDRRTLVHILIPYMEGG